MIDEETELGKQAWNLNPPYLAFAFSLLKNKGNPVIFLDWDNRTESRFLNKIMTANSLEEIANPGKIYVPSETLESPGHIRSANKKYNEKDFQIEFSYSLDTEEICRDSYEREYVGLSSQSGEPMFFNRPTIKRTQYNELVLTGKVSHKGKEVLSGEIKEIDTYRQNSFKGWRKIYAYVPGGWENALYKLFVLERNKVRRGK